jgi:ribosomal protein S18 acetylase RimI-like enzyme
MMPFPDHYDEALQPLPAQQMNEAAQAAIASLKTKGYEVQAGLMPEYADAIALMSRETSIREYCPKDCSERFASRETTASWLSKKRATYLLLQVLDDGTKQLAGYGWVGSKQSEQIPGGETTFSLRISEHHQGKGLATPFALTMLNAAEVTYGTPNMWLETWASNAGAVHIYQKLGFNTIAEKPDKRPSADGQMVEDTRLYMTGEQADDDGDDITL